MSAPEFISRAAVLTRTGLTDTGLDLAISTGSFPRPFRVGVGFAWKVDQVEIWCQMRGLPPPREARDEHA